MVKGSMGKVSLAALRSCRYFLGENKKSRREILGRARVFLYHRAVISWSKLSTRRMLLFNRT
jgi:hypothetical protein